MREVFDHQIHSIHQIEHVLGKVRLMLHHHHSTTQHLKYRKQRIHYNLSLYMIFYRKEIFAIDSSFSQILVYSLDKFFLVNIPFLVLCADNSR